MSPALLLRRVAVLPIRLYQWVLSPLLPRSCRFAPSCSEYAAEAVLAHGLIKGVQLVVARLLRCHPWGGHGYDPVPPAASSAEAPLARPERDAISRAPMARPRTR